MIILLVSRFIHKASSFLESNNIEIQFTLKNFYENYTLFDRMYTYNKFIESIIYRQNTYTQKPNRINWFLIVYTYRTGGMIKYKWTGENFTTNGILILILI